MKTGLKQKHSTLQTIIDNAQSGGGSVDAYTKAESDAKFETITNAAATYQKKSDMTDYVKEETGGYIIVNSIRVYVSATQPVDAPTGSIWIGG